MATENLAIYPSSIIISFIFEFSYQRLNFTKLIWYMIFNQKTTIKLRGCIGTYLKLEHDTISCHWYLLKKNAIAIQHWCFYPLLLFLPKYCYDTWHKYVPDLLNIFKKGPKRCYLYDIHQMLDTLVRKFSIIFQIYFLSSRDLNIEWRCWWPIWLNQIPLSQPGDELLDMIPKSSCFYYLWTEWTNLLAASRYIML